MMTDEEKRKRFLTPYHELHLLDDEKADTVEPMVTDPKEELRDEAVAYLTERGKDIPERELVVGAAEDLAYDECVATMVDGVDSFDGDENCGEYGECGGWDGESNRCDCGNRRVYWEMGYGASFKDMYVIATAY